MENLENWKEVTRGLYRYVIATKVCYEISIVYHDEETDILTAQANLYIAGSWVSKSSSYFERELLLERQPVFECIRAAIKDDEENNV